MKKILEQLLNFQSLSKKQSREVLMGMSHDQYNDYEITAFITVYLMRSIRVEELEGFQEALLELCLPLSFTTQGDFLDIVGTGGDGKNTFNISTLASFIVAGAGYKVVKHGNYSSRVISGASHVMEYVGYKFKTNQDALQRELEQTNMCYLHAPLFHPALKRVAAIRKNLPIRTFFNLLGPLIHPAQPTYQCVGVYHMEVARLYEYYFQRTKKHFTIIHSIDGYDEISLTNDVKIITPQGHTTLTPEQVGYRMVFPNDLLAGNTIEEAATIFIRILKGEATHAQQAVVLANAAVAIQGMNTALSHKDAYQEAVESLESKKAWHTFEKLIQLQ